MHYIRTEVIEALTSGGGNVYVTGHSLGGWLSQMFYHNMTSNIYTNRAQRISRVVVFNSIGTAINHSTLIEAAIERNGTEFIQFFVCCDMARLTGENAGFAFPGRSYVITKRLNWIQRAAGITTRYVVAPSNESLSGSSVLLPDYIQIDSHEMNHICGSIERARLYTTVVRRC
jgi:hypothetical protein